MSTKGRLERPNVAALKMEERGAQQCVWLPEAGKRQGTHSPLELPEGTQPWRRPDLTLLRLPLDL